MTDEQTTTTAATPPPCPHCSGRWLRDLLHQHQTSCPRYDAELAPRAADARRPWARALRAPTPTELAVIAELNYQEPGPNEYYLIGVETTPLYRRQVMLTDGSKRSLNLADSPYITDDENGEWHA